MALRSGRVGIHPSQVDPITGMLLNGPTPGSISFEDLSDAQISNPEAGQTLIYNGTGGENEFSSISPTTLAALQDVQITDPEDGAYLVYDAENSKWINSTTPPAPVVPEGSTVTPTDDIQTWLACAGITDKTYTTLNEVLADSTTLLALMSDNNAVDYLVRSTTWASGVCANSTAMTDIGANNYCANTLLDDATWYSAICNSTYLESVLNVKVPTMTDYTTPSGEVIENEHFGTDYGWKAFDGNDSTYWNCLNINNGILIYKFPSPVKIKLVKYSSLLSTNNLPKSITISGSSDNTSYTDMQSYAASQVVGENNIDLRNNDTSYSYLKFGVSASYASTSFVVNTLQFYGRQDV